MTYATIIFIIIAVSTGAWGLFCTIRRPGWLSTLLFSSVLLVCYLSTVELMGRPKPIQFEYADYEIEQILAYTFKHNVAIYLWIDVGQEEPIAYSLPWNNETAESLQEAFQKRGDADKVIAEHNQINRLVDSRDEVPVFHAEPQPSPEPKNYSDFE